MSNRTYEKNGRRYRYRYRVVISLGCGVLSKDHVNRDSARLLADKARERWPDAEVERVREILSPDDSVWARQYELERSGKWVVPGKDTDQ